jgi:hypothetical protein
MKRMALVLSSAVLMATATTLVGAPIASASCDGGGDLATTATAYDAPGPPQNLMVAAGNQSVVLFWDPPAFTGGGVDFYRVYVDGTRRLRTTQTQARVNNLVNGQTYSFYVTANNDCGESAPSDPVTATPSTGQSAEIIRGSNLSMSTGGKNATAADPFVGSQTFPAGTTGIGTLKEEADGGFCNGSCLAGRVLVNSLENGTLGGPSYTITLLYNRTVLQSSDSAARGESTPPGFTVYYDGTKGQTPIQLENCSVAPIPCVAKLVRNDGDLIVKVRTDDIDPRLGTR